MKKILLVTTGLMVLTTGAYASKARKEALRDSFLVTDTRDIMDNPADLNTMKNFVITEWGTAVNTTTDAKATPHPEGGFFKDAGKIAYGVYMNNQPATAFNNTRTTANFIARDNNLDLFVAGDMGVQWGARLSYASAKDEQTNAWKKDQQSVGLGLGVNIKDLKVFANADLKDQSKGDNTDAGYKWEGKLNPNITAEYNLMGIVLHAKYSNYGYKKTVATTTEVTTTAMEFGAGKVHDVSKTARLFTDVVYNNDKTETKVPAKTEDKNMDLTAKVGYEVDATSWLTLRGAISQQLMGYNTNNNKKKKTDLNTADVAAGATLNFGQLKVDGLIGTDTVPAETAGVLRTDALMSRVAVHYWF